MGMKETRTSLQFYFVRRRAGGSVVNTTFGPDKMTECSILRKFLIKRDFFCWILEWAFRFFQFFPFVKSSGRECLVE